MDTTEKLAGELHYRIAVSFCETLNGLFDRFTASFSADMRARRRLFNELVAHIPVEVFDRAAAKLLSARPAIGARDVEGLKAVALADDDVRKEGHLAASLLAEAFGLWDEMSKSDRRFVWRTVGVLVKECESWAKYASA